jgi:hypothetical protein
MAEDVLGDSGPHNPTLHCQKPMPCLKEESHRAAGDYLHGKFGHQSSVTDVPHRSYDLMPGSVLAVNEAGQETGKRANFLLPGGLPDSSSMARSTFPPEFFLDLSGLTVVRSCRDSISSEVLSDIRVKQTTTSDAKKHRTGWLSLLGFYCFSFGCGCFLPW